MDMGVILVVVIIAIVLLSPVLLFRPLILAISNRISGKQVNTDDVKMLKAKVALLEDQVHEMRTRMLSIEDSHDFSKKILEDVVGKSTSENKK
jgi:hypothetical protein